MRILMPGLGNELMGADAVGVLAARPLASEARGEADVVENAVSGLALLDLFLDYGRAQLLDAVHPVGTRPAPRSRSSRGP